MALVQTMRRMGHGDVVPHGFRSSFRDWAGETTDYPRELAEHALAHRVGNEVEQSYRRGKAVEKRRPMMAEWASFVTSKPAVVVPLRKVG
jgi:integrase